MKVLLAHLYDDSIDPTGWYMSEKMDGIRAQWTGSNLVSRNGNILPAPRWFVEGFPAKIPMDGELWIGRKQFQKASSIIRSGSTDKGWNQVSYLTFDIPIPEAGPVETRWEALQTLVKHVGKKNLQYLPQTPCKSREHLFQTLDIAIQHGSEGLMLRKPRSRYVGARSDTLLKVKRYYDDEAIVIGYEEIEIKTEGKKHLIGAMGALICKDRKGIEFKVGSGFDETQRLHPPPIGSTITYKYLEKRKSGKPFAPIFKCVRYEE